MEAEPEAEDKEILPATVVDSAKVATCNVNRAEQSRAAQSRALANSHDLAKIKKLKNCFCSIADGAENSQGVFGIFYNWMAGR